MWHTLRSSMRRNICCGRTSSRGICGPEATCWFPRLQPPGAPQRLPAANGSPVRGRRDRHPAVHQTAGYRVHPRHADRQCCEIRARREMHRCCFQHNTVGSRVEPSPESNAGRLSAVNCAVSCACVAGCRGSRTIPAARQQPATSAHSATPFQAAVYASACHGPDEEPVAYHLYSCPSK